MKLGAEWTENDEMRRITKINTEDEKWGSKEELGKRKKKRNRGEMKKKWGAEKAQKE